MNINKHEEYSITELNYTYIEVIYLGLLSIRNEEGFTQGMRDCVSELILKLDIVDPKV